MTTHTSTLSRLTVTRASAAVVLIRLYVGLVFACEGVLKFCDPTRWARAGSRKLASQHRHS